MQFGQIGFRINLRHQPRRSKHVRTIYQPRDDDDRHLDLEHARDRFHGNRIMRVALMGFWVGLYGAGLSVGSHLVSLDAATWGELSGTLIGFTLLITVITRGLASPDRPRSFNRIND